MEKGLPKRLAEHTMQNLPPQLFSLLEGLIYQFKTSSVGYVPAEHFRAYK